MHALIIFAVALALTSQGCSRSAPDTPAAATPAPPTSTSTRAVSTSDSLAAQAAAAPAPAPAEPCTFGDLVECPLRCAAGDLESCYFHARALNDGQGVPKDRAKATATIRELCAKGHADSCNAAAYNQLMEGGTLRKDDDAVRAVLPLYEVACKLGSSKGCNNLGSYLRRPAFGRREESLGFFIRSCELGKSSAITGCSEAAGTLKEGKYGTAPDQQRAATYYRRGCLLGSDEQCASAAALGLPSSLPPTEAAALRDQACRRGDYRSCLNRARALKEGRGVPRDAKESARLYELVCRGDTQAGHGCAGFADLVLDGEVEGVDNSRAAEALRIGCDDENAWCCRVLGDLTVMGQAGITSNRDEAARLYERACTLKAPTGCQEAGALKSMSKDLASAAVAQQLFISGCSAGDDESCAALKRNNIPHSAVAAMAASGKQRLAEVDARACDKDSSGRACFEVGIGHDRKKERDEARPHLDRACRAGFARGCTAMGAYLTAGWGGEKNLDQALVTYARACVLGDDGACPAAKARVKAVDKFGADARRQAEKMLADGCKAGITGACR